jgi:hypothetical protein
MLSAFQIHIALSMMAVIERKFSVHFTRNYFQQQEHCFLFGYEPDNPKQPWIELKISEGGIGDSLSGSIEYEDNYSLKNFYLNPTQPIRLYYERLATNIAGDCSALRSSSFDEAEWMEVENIFLNI